MDIADMPPEIELLCCLTRPNADYRRALELTATGLDWTRVFKLAAMHGVRPHLLHAFRSPQCSVEASEIKEKLERFEWAQAARNLTFTRELLRIADKFDACGIPFATFKGATLALSLYGGLARREFNDIDVIVHHADMPAAEEALQSCGYRAKFGAAHYRSAFLAYHQQHMFVNDDSSIGFDLHWGFAPKGMPFPIHADTIWGNLETVQIGGRQIPTLGRDDLAIFLAGHGTKERWRCLGWICDFAFFYDSHTEIDWSALIARSRQIQCERPILLGCTLISELMGISVNPKILHSATRQPSIQALVHSIVTGISASSTEADAVAAGTHVDLVLCETSIQKLNVLLRLCFTPTVGDYETMPIPRSLWPLYHVTRPIRLVGKFLSESL